MDFKAGDRVAWIERRGYSAVAHWGEVVRVELARDNFRFNGQLQDEIEVRLDKPVAGQSFIGGPVGHFSKNA